MTVSLSEAAETLPHWRAGVEKRWSNDTIATGKGDTSVHRLHSRALMQYTGATQKGLYAPTRALALTLWGQQQPLEGRLIKYNWTFLEN